MFRSPLLATLILVAGCATARPAATPPAELAPATWTATSSPDSIAAWAVNGCRAAREKQACYEKALVAAMRPAGVDRAMAALDRIAAADAEVVRHGHVLAHGLGISAYEGAATVGQTFSKCTPAYQSGCYHGVIQAYFADAGSAGATAERLNALCADYRAPSARWIRFHCAHGAGHGLMAVHGQHLLRALEGCDLLSNAMERDACWGGAFMENIVNATNPHHTSTTQLAGGAGHHGHAPPAAHDAHSQSSGHDHGATRHEAFKALDPDEPLYPCTVVAEHHRTSCYTMQTSAILVHNRGDFADAARQCTRAPEQHRRACFISLGRDAAAYSRGNDARAIELCGKAPEADLPWCIVGATKNRVDVTANPADGLALCRAVPGAAAKSACYRAVGEQIYALFALPADRERACAAAESAFVAPCRAGANLPVRDS